MTDPRPTPLAARTLTTTATQVTFFEDRARVTRQVNVDINTSGRHTLHLTGITRFIDDQSLTAQLPEGSALILARVKRDVVPEGDEETDTTTDAQALEASRRDLHEATLRTTQDLERCQHELTHAHQLIDALLAQIRLVPGGDACSPDAFTRSLEHLEAAIASLQDREKLLHEKLHEERLELDLVQQRLERARDLDHEIIAYVELQLDVAEPAPLLITITYMTGGALWRPSHRAQLLKWPGEPTRGALLIEKQATVWQRTGELWGEIDASFSTARPTQSAKPPTLRDDILYTRPKTHEERHIIDVSARDEVIFATGAHQGRQDVEAMPGVDDGGEPLTLHATAKIFVRSDGQAHQVPVGQVELPCEVDILAIPERTDAPHLRARTIWSDSEPLLAGPVTLLREQELAGQAVLQFIAPGTPLDLGFGPLSTLRVRREARIKALDKKLARWHHQQRDTILHISNMSARPQTVHILERIPVSEIEQVEVRLKETADATPDEDGLLTIPVTLQGHEQRRLRIRYELSYDPKVRLDF